MTPTRYICAECTSPDVQTLEWVQVNTEQGGKHPHTVELANVDPHPTDDPSCNFCNNCKKHVVLAVDLTNMVVPKPPALPVTPKQFADYIWELCSLLNGGGDASVDSPKSAEVALMQSFASFFSCAADDELWDTELGDHEFMAIDDNGDKLDTPMGLMHNLYLRVRQVMDVRALGHVKGKSA